MILNTSISGGGAKLNGVRGNYLATADVAKGDFVQLTTWGVEEPKFSKSHDLADGVNAFNRAAVVVMSSTQILCVWSANESMPNNVYAQAVTYKDAAWVAGTALLLGSYSNASSYVNAVSADRLTDTQAAVAIGSANKIMVVNIAENGEITVAAEGAADMTVSGGSKTFAVVALTPECFTILYSTKFSSGESLKCNVCSFTGGTITVATSTGSIESNSSSGLGARYCKLNDTTVLVAASSNGNFYAIGIAESGWTELATLSDNHAKDCDIAYWENNKVVVGVDSSTILSGFVVFDPSAKKLTVENVATNGMNVSALYAIEKISDDKACIWYVNDNAHWFGVLDVTDGTVVSSTVSDLSTKITSAVLGKLTSAAFGWFALLEGATKLWIAPCITQTTAAPYQTRLDGVASKGAIAGQMAEVVTPK